MSVFYPSIRDLVAVEDIPDSLGFLQQALDDLLSDIYYKDLIISNSRDHTRGFYSITIVLYTRLALPLPGGFALLVNPDIESNTNTLIPVEFSYEWPILKYFVDFDITNFGAASEDFFNLLLEIVGIDEQEFLTNLIEVFMTNTDPIGQFVTEYNDPINGNTPITVPTGLLDMQSMITDLVGQTAGAGINLFATIFNSFLVGTDIDETLANLVTLFNKWFGNFDFDELGQRLIPQFVVSLPDVNIALEFPNNVLRRLDPTTLEPELDDNGDPLKSLLIFNVGAFEYSTKTGFAVKLENSFDLPLSEIGRTGLTLSIDTAKIDVDNSINTLPGTDNYPTDFKGIHIEEIIIGLPPFWTKDPGQTGIDIFGRDVLIGGYDDNGSPKTIFSGTVGLEGQLGNSVLKTTLPGGLGLSLDHFSLTFFENAVTASSVQGTLTIPLNSGDKDIVLNGAYSDNGFSLTASGSGGQPLFTIPLGSFGEIRFMFITIGSEDGKFFFSFSANMPYESGFPIIDKILPNPIDLQEFRVSERGIEKFDINLRWNDLDEVAMDSAFGQDAFTIPVNLSILDIITISTLKIVLGQTNTNAVSIKTLIDAKLEIGPMLATVGDIGIQSIIDYDSNGGGNLGPLDVEFKFVPPTKIGLKIDAEAVTGGGAIWFDFDNERYVGALELSVKETLELVVIGIMGFKKPDGSKGFSLLLLVTVEFAPVQLGMGFVLTGVGGLLGINRGMNADVLRDGVRTGLLDYILFPQDPVANIAAIVQGLETAFPQRQDQFIIGPMVKLGWGGAKALVKVEIGLLIELFRPVRIAIPGVLSIELPTEDEAVVSIKVSFIGIIDFQDKFASFDASLFDSSILEKITISGDMAFRLKWGDEPDFLMSMGGFHPEYTPPPLKLPKMERIGISLLNLENAQVGFELYFAVSTNSVQTGAAVFAEFRASKSVYLEASFSFDVLFEFDPFRMILSAQLKGALVIGGIPIVSISALIRLSGPTPWNISGAASIAIIGIEFKIDFDHTFGEEIDTSVPSIELLPRVLEELEKPSNWRSAFPAGSKSMVQFRAVEDSESVAAHPSGRFTVEQRITPFNIRLDKYGQNGIADAKEYQITKISLVSAGLPDEELETSPLFNLFTPDQHFTLTDDEKLSRPSFERYISGAIIDKTDKLFVSKAQVKEVAYEQLLVQPSIQDPDNIQYMQSTVVTEKDTFESLSTGGAVGQSSLSKQSRPISEDIVWDKSTGHYIVNDITMQPFVSSAYLPEVKTLSLSEAQHLLQLIIENEPQLEDLLIILEQHELDTGLITNPANEVAVLAM